MLKRAAIYARVSTEDQAREGDSIPAQCEALRRYVAEHEDLVLAGEYVDAGISGQKFKERDELQRLLEDVKRGQIDIILFCKLDRWYRSIRHYTATQEILDKHGVTWLAIWEPIYDTTTPSGRLIVNQMMSIAQFEAENTGQRIKQVFAYKIQQGEVLSGSCPPGYSIKDKHFVPNEQADMVRDMFRYYIETNSMRQTMFHIEHVYGLIKDVRSVRRYLTNRLYIGEYRGNQTYCEPIVDKETFDTVQRMLKRNVRPNQKHEYIFTGMMVCTECGHNMVGKLARNQNPKTYPLYYCKQNHDYHRCSNGRSMTERTLEKLLLSRIRDELQKYVVDFEVEQKKRKNVDGKVRNLEGKVRRLKELYVNGLISLEDLKADLDRYQGEIQKLREDADRPDRDMSEIQAFLKMDFESIYPTLTNTERRRLWGSIIKEMRMDKDRNIEIIFL